METSSMEKNEQLLRELTLQNLVILGYMTFCNEKGILKEGMEYVKGFTQCFTKEELEAVFQKAKKSEQL